MTQRMKGVVFTELLDWIEQHHGVVLLDEVLLDAGLPHGGAYTQAGSYDCRELVAILDVAGRQLGQDRTTLLRSYGRHLFGVLAQQYPDFLAKAQNAFDFLTQIESFIHPEVAKLHHDAELPRFRIESLPNGITLEYGSVRPTAPLAHGLIEGCLEHFETAADIELRSEGERHRFLITRPEVACRETL